MPLIFFGTVCFLPFSSVFPLCPVLSFVNVVAVVLSYGCIPLAEREMNWAGWGVISYLFFCMFLLSVYVVVMGTDQR